MLSYIFKTNNYSFNYFTVFAFTYSFLLFFVIEYKSMDAKAILYILVLVFGSLLALLVAKDRALYQSESSLFIILVTYTARYLRCINYNHLFGAIKRKFAK